MKLDVVLHYKCLLTVKRPTIVRLLCDMNVMHVRVIHIRLALLEFNLIKGPDVLLSYLSEF